MHVVIVLLVGLGVLDAFRFQATGLHESQGFVEAEVTTCLYIGPEGSPPDQSRTSMLPQPAIKIYPKGLVSDGCRGQNGLYHFF